MDLKLSWDLFVIVFFAIVAAYSFIIGRKETLKIIIATYIGTLCADGLGNIFQGALQTSPSLPRMLEFMGFSGGVFQFSSVFKILLFIAIIVVLTIWGDYEVEDPSNENAFISLAILTLLSVLSCGLILSTIIVFANGGSLIGGTASITPAFANVYEQSRLVKNLLDWHDAWFALPGLAFVVISIFQRNRGE
ncbi:MAG: hypothetical protein ACRCZE_01115 [Candidatus Altimarinota bacterium]